ncbi:DUF1433 domain-containing protein [Staphylococcus epidermidis]|uniref:DUF1433 domain-containing protein n=1 Tax=Staphylococcus epidermidis TaxID=1282 RepID=UPI0034D4D00B
MKYDEKKESEAKYYDEQEKKITLFLKYNMKDFRGIKFIEHKRNQMGNFVFKGYVNDDKNKTLQLQHIMTMIINLKEQLVGVKD